MANLDPLFTSDLHLGHKGVSEKCNRPWSSDDNIEQIVRIQNSQATSQHITYHVGDFSFLTDYGMLQKAAMSFNGRLFLIPGNHCKVNVLQDLADRSHGKIKLLPHYHEISLRKKLICMLHYPMQVWNRSHYGSFHLHGHTHGNLNQVGAGRRLDVGIDAHPFKRMYTTDEIFETLEAVEPYDPESRVYRENVQSNMCKTDRYGE